MERLVAFVLFILVGGAVLVALLPYLLAGYILYLILIVLAGVGALVSEALLDGFWRWRRRAVPDAPPESMMYSKSNDCPVRVGDHVLNDHIGLGEVIERRKQNLVVEFRSGGRMLIKAHFVRRWGD